MQLFMNIQLNATAKAITIAFCFFVIYANHSILNASNRFVLSPEFWNTSQLQSRFAESYAPHGDVEPTINAAERDLFRDLMPIIRSNPQTAVQRLLPFVTKDASAAVDFTLANLYFQLGQNVEAANAYRQAIAKFPTFRRAYMNMGLLLVRMGNFDDARSALARAIELGAIDGNSYGLLGYCHLQMRQPTSAEAAYRVAIMFQPDNTDWQLGLAQSLLSQRRNAEAAALFGEQIAKNPDRGDLWLFQANAFIAMNEPMLAAANFEIYNRMQSPEADILNTLGDIYLRQGNAEMALDAYLKSISTKPDQSIGRIVQASRILIQRRDYPRATAILEHVNNTMNLREEADKLEVLKLQSQLALSTGKDEKALKILEEIVKIDPMNGEALLLLARAFSQSNRIAEAEFTYQNAIGISAVEVDAKIQFGQFLVNQQRYSEAVQYLREAQSLRPRDNVESYIEQVERLARMRR
jgi:Tfp pilus assembly protein PilF